MMKQLRMSGRSEMTGSYLLTKLPDIILEKFLLRFGNAIDYLPPTRASWSEGRGSLYGLRHVGEKFFSPSVEFHDLTLIRRPAPTVQGKQFDRMSSD